MTTHPHSPAAPLSSILPGALASLIFFLSLSPAHADSHDPFLPSRHGFAFVNTFRGSPLPFDLGPIAHRLGAPSTFGLCGGMSLAALDHFLARTPPPATHAPPAPGSPLYQYLYRRQLDSLGPALSYTFRFAEWMALPDDTPSGIMALSFPQLIDLLEPLRANQPVPIGLVLVGANDNKPVWNNHQVLACAVSRTAPDTFVIRIYDPNYPAHDNAVIRTSVRIIAPRDSLAPSRWPPLPVLGLSSTRIVPGRSVTPVRGFFRMPYSPVEPPGDLER